MLAYTDMELQAHLRRKEIRIEMYAPRIMTTLYTRVVELSLLYELWEIFLFERDKFFIFYFAVGLMIGFKEDIMRLNTFEQLIVFLQGLKITSHSFLADVYLHAIQVRRHAPASFHILIASLGIFKYKPIISNEELETIKAVSLIETMPIYPKELLFGSEQTLATLKDNNNKFKNLLVISEDEQ